MLAALLEEPLCRNRLPRVIGNVYPISNLLVVLQRDAQKEIDSVKECLNHLLNGAAYGPYMFWDKAFFPPRRIPGIGFAPIGPWAWNQAWLQLPWRFTAVLHIPYSLYS